MQKPVITLLFLTLIAIGAHANSTKRIPQFSNDKVSIWKTVIYPSSNQVLKMHRHEHDRVVVAFDSGKLKVVSDKGNTHYLTLEKNKAYYLKKDIPGEMHTDENMTQHPIKVLVIEFNR